MTIDIENLSSAEIRALALSALVQAALLVEKSAFGRETPDTALNVLYQSLYVTNPGDFTEIIPNLDDLTLGVTYLRKVFQSQPDNADNRTLGYVLNVIQLEKKLRKRPDLLGIITESISALDARYEMPEDRLQPNAIAELAELYRKTLGELRPRIEVKGEASHLQDAPTAAKIRSLLLTGIRFAMLWRQLGGRRWHLVFQQKQILANLNRLYDRLSANQLLH